VPVIPVIRISGNCWLTERKGSRNLPALTGQQPYLRRVNQSRKPFTRLSFFLPSAWQYPEFTVARIIFEEREYKSPGFKTTEWLQSQSFTTVDDHQGVVEVYYTKKFAGLHEGPFLKEERNLIDNICSLLVGYINSYKAKTILFRTRKKESQQKKHAEDRQDIQQPAAASAFP
jgi:hypothetical protein